MNSIVPSSTDVAKAHSSRRIARFEDHAAMPALLRELPPQAVASLFQEIGVVDSGVLMAMMPSRALLLAFDESIWKSARPGLPETISVRELVDWFIAWSEIGEHFLVEKIDAMSEDYLTTVLSHVVKVESASRYAVYSEDPEAFVKLCEDDRERIGPYIVEPTVDDDVVMDLVRALWCSGGGKIMRVFGRLSDLADPMDSTRGSTATSRDIESERDSHREAQGFVTADGARAFLAFAERMTEPEIFALDGYDAETRRYLDAVERATESPNATHSPVINDDLEGDHEADPNSSIAVGSIAADANTASLRSLLEKSQLLEKQNSTPLHSVPLLKNVRRSKEAILTVELRRLADENIDSFHARARELGYLANVLRWLPNEPDVFRDKYAKDAAFAICNLGLELTAGPYAVEQEKEPGLIRLFMLGLNAVTSLRARVLGAFASALSRQKLAPWLQSEATAGLADLRRAVENKQFAEARDAVVFLSIVFDSSVCHALAPLVSAIPRFSTLLDGAGNSHHSRWIETKTDLQILARLLDSVRLKSEKRGGV